MAIVQFDCPGCGAQLEYDPRSEGLRCPFCGRETRIPRAEEDIRELDYKAHLGRASAAEETTEVLTVQCGACGAASTSEPDVTSTRCPFCGTHIVSTARSHKAIKPRSLLPFKVTRDEAGKAFRRWLASLWFAPSGLKQRARQSEALAGVYIPHWTYDCKTMTFYRGACGEDYYVTRRFTVMEAGHRVTRTQKVRKTRWHPVSGWVSNSFDNVLVLASRSLPPRFVDLNPWDLDALVPYEDAYLSGFRSESYQVPLDEGFETARSFIDRTVRRAVLHDIAGDRQRIHAIKTQYDDITFKHILLPVWISAYRYRDRVFRFLVNGRSGEVQSDRPWSWVKIALTILAAAAAMAGLVFLLD